MKTIKNFSQFGMCLRTRTSSNAPIAAPLILKSSDDGIMSQAKW